MRSFWRSILVWLMLLAVPVQGLAGTAMQHCADRPARSGPQAPAEAAHHAMASLTGLSGPAASPAAEGPGHDHHRHHDHGAAGAAADGAAGSSGPGDLQAAGSSPDGDHQCSACAACCSAMGLPTRIAALTPPQVATTASARPLLAVDSFVPAGPDRPPRAQAR